VTHLIRRDAISEWNPRSGLDMTATLERSGETMHKARLYRRFVFEFRQVLSSHAKEERTRFSRDASFAF